MSSISSLCVIRARSHGVQTFLETLTSECQQHDRAADNSPCSQTLFFQYNFTLKSSQGIKQNILSS